MSDVIAALDVSDVRFPTSAQLDGSDAMNPEPDYSVAYVIVRTSAGDEGHGFAFTIGRGTEIEVAAEAALAPLLVGRDVDDVLSDLGGTSRRLTGDSPLRWLGPDKGVIHMATGAVMNALWDLKAKRAGQPVWELLSAMSPDELVDLVDFRYLDDVMSRDEALELLRRAEPGRARRRERLLADGYPAYTTSVGWLGYSDEKLVRLSREAVADGFSQIKIKVGASIEDDMRRLKLVRDAVGPDVAIAIDANQVWGVEQAIEWTNALKPFDPYWIEEPTSPDDVLGHVTVRRGVAPVRVAAGEHVHNQVMFKQLLQAGGIDVVQIDACRVAGVNENVAILLLAAKFGAVVCPHGGGVGLCETVQHLAMFDYVAISGSQDGRAIEYVDHLHEHFTDPVVMRGARYSAPRAPGFSTELLASSRATYGYPDGQAWR